MLPQALIKRVDIVTGGASASYGSDAVAGAINFVLNDNYEGVGAALSSGVSQYGDNLEIHGSLTGGVALLGDRLHIIANIDYINNFGASGDSRPFRLTDANAITTVANPNAYILIPNLRAVGSFGGYVTAATVGTVIAAANRTSAQNIFINQQFNNAGTLVPYNPGTSNNGSFQNGGDGINTSIIQDVSRPLRRRSAFLRGQYNITSNMTLFMEGIYGHSDAEQNDGEFAVGANVVTIRSDNPFLSPTQSAAMANFLGATPAEWPAYIDGTCASKQGRLKEKDA